MYEPITDSRQGVIKGGQNPDWFGGRFGIRQTLLTELFKVTTTMDLMVILQRFQMADHFGSHCRILLDPLFNFGGQRMSRFQRSVFGKEQMEFHPSSIARIAMPQPMKLHPGFGSHLDQQSPDLSLCHRIDFIHQPTNRLANQLAPNPKDVQGDKNRINRIKTQPACEEGQTQSHEDTETGPAFGEYM